MQEVFDKIIEKIKTNPYTKLYGSRNSGNYMIPVDVAIEIVKQKAAEHNNDWIPCSERLPEDTVDDEFYPMNLVTLDSGDVCLGVYRNHDCEWWVRMNEGRSIYSTENEVIAWQPLPAPYQPEGEIQNTLV